MRFLVSEELARTPDAKGDTDLRQRADDAVARMVHLLSHVHSIDVRGISSYFKQL